jgi:hypothetical protein
MGTIMGFAQWMRVIDTLGNLIQLTGRARRPADPEAQLTRGGALGQLETRLAGVVVAALKEAFDRDRARLDLERAHLESERQRAEDALRVEIRRQSADRALGQLRLIAVMALGTWMLSAVLGVWLPGMRQGTPRLLMGIGWALAIGALGCAFAAWQYVSTWSADARGAPGATPVHPAAAAAPWLLIAALALTGAALLFAL